MLLFVYPAILINSSAFLIQHPKIMHIESHEFLIPSEHFVTWLSPFQVMWQFNHLTQMLERVFEMNLKPEKATLTKLVFAMFEMDCSHHFIYM